MFSGARVQYQSGIQGPGSPFAAVADSMIKQGPLTLCDLAVGAAFSRDIRMPRGLEAAPTRGKTEDEQAHIIQGPYVGWVRKIQGEPAPK